MTGEARFCPQCGTRRAGFFRFCPQCGFDFDELLSPDHQRPADPKVAAPTSSTVVRASDLWEAAISPRPASPTPWPATPIPGTSETATQGDGVRPAARPTTPVTPAGPVTAAPATVSPPPSSPAVRPTQPPRGRPTKVVPAAVAVAAAPAAATAAPAATAATAAPAAATAPAAAVAPAPASTPPATAPSPPAAAPQPVAPPDAPPKPAVWPPPGALPAEVLEEPARTPTFTPQQLGRLGSAATAASATRSVPAAQAVAAPVPTEKVRPSRATRVLSRRPDLTLTRIAIIVLAALLGFSALSNMARSSDPSTPTPTPASGVGGSPLVGESADPGESPSPSIATEPAFGPSGSTQFAVVTSITDGDTIRVDIEGTEYPLRYIGMDSPEPDATDPGIKRLADAATAANASLVEGKEVYLEREVSDVDRFGRLLRDVWMVDSGGSYVLVNLELVRLGFAQIATFPPDVRYVRELTAAQEQAQADGIGVWGLAGPVPTESAGGSAGAAGSPGASPGGVQATPQTLVGGGAAAACHPSYDPCLPITDDLDCAEVRALGVAPVTVKGPDEYMLDAEEDGLGCESNE